MAVFVRFAVPAAVALVIVLAALAPLVRSRLAYGRWGLVVLEEANRVQRVVGAAMGFVFAVVLGLAAACAALGPSALDAWPAGPIVAFAGCALVGVATLVVIVAQHQMGASWRIGIDPSPTSLVTRGLFRVVRNPIFTGMIATTLGLSLLLPCGWTIMTSAMTIVVIAIQTRLEEEHLEALHGDSYLRYAARVGRFFPGVGCYARAA
jgi:protein-S-isoprenylcysteine O-methyltransferase Ste14